MEGERKNFYKKLIFHCIFFNNEKCFPLHVCKVFLSNSEACDLQPAVSNFAVHEKGQRQWKHLPWDPFRESIIVKTQKVIND